MEKNVNCEWLEVRFYGAARMVVGSCPVVTATVNGEENSYMFDCGMMQGKIARKHGEYNKNIVEVVKKVKVAFATHGHIDHIGRYPFAYKLGYRGPIYCTKPVRDLALPLLKDSARIQQHDYDVALKNVSTHAEFEKVTEKLAPLYTEEDCEETVKQMVPVERNRWIKVDNILSVRFTNAGHSLGSSCIEAKFNNGKEEIILLFSGDVGAHNPILKRRVRREYQADYVFMETTYGARLHEPMEESIEKAIEEIASTLLKGGNVVVPAFAAGRTQEFVYELYCYMAEHDDWRAEVLRRTPIYIDSFLSVSLTRDVYLQNPEEFKLSIRKMLKNKGNNPFSFPNLYYSETKEESMEISARTEPTIIISSAGMCNAGRILYHLANNLPKRNSLVLLIGYQAEGTLGRSLLEGATSVKIHKIEYRVHAKVLQVSAFSAHCDQNELNEWHRQITTEHTLFLVHGEAEQQDGFKARYLLENPERRVEIPTLETVYHLSKKSFSKSYVAPPKVEKSEDEPPVKKPHVAENGNGNGYKKTLTRISQLKDLVDSVDEFAELTDAQRWSIVSNLNALISEAAMKIHGKKKGKKERRKIKKHGKR
ncbi:MAG: MBL fold metallo-hydrolase [Clostridia bacterium]|nr:MBL fold metallo-hydrolase [Clostridia bacterium]